MLPTRRRSLRQTLFGISAVVAVAATAAIVLLAGRIAQAQYVEDLCFDDVVAEGSYRSELRTWPPSYRCHVVDGDGAARTVEHRLLGWLIVSWPVFVLAATLAALVALRLREAARWNRSWPAEAAGRR